MADVGLLATIHVFAVVGRLEGVDMVGVSVRWVLASRQSAKEFGGDVSESQGDR